MSTVHYDKHPNDCPHPPGYKRVRTDKLGPFAPASERKYDYVRAGYGEGARIEHKRWIEIVASGASDEASKEASP